MATTSDGSFKSLQHNLTIGVARKCIVCGKTKHENCMKPFLLKGDSLNVWTNAYFCYKRQKLYNFYSKLRYTLNPFACVDHFTATPDSDGLLMPPPPLPPVLQGRPLFPAPITTKMGHRTCLELLSEGEEPPSIQRITEKKPSPEPEEVKDPRSKEEVSDVIMSILKVAKVEMDKEEKTRKMIAKITRKMFNIDEFEDSDDAPVVPPAQRVKKMTKKMKKKKKKKKKRTSETEKKAVDGNEADSDTSTIIDVVGLDSEKEEESTDSGEEETDATESVTGASDDDDVISMGPPPSPLLPQPRRYPTNGPAPATVIVPRLRPQPQYMIATPTMINGKQKMVLKMPSRLTPTGKVVWRRHPQPARFGIAPNTQLQRPSWVAANPEQARLAAVLQKYWNEDDLAPPALAPSSSRMPPRLVDPRPRSLPPRPFGRVILPGTRTKFVPAVLKDPSLSLKSHSSSMTLQFPSARNPATLPNPLLSPSRLIVSNEETVEAELNDSDRESTKVAMSVIASSDDEENSDVEVCSVGPRMPIMGPKIEAAPDEIKSVGTRSRTVSMFSSSSDDLTIVTSDEDDVEVDVETLDATLEKNEQQEVTVADDSAPTPTIPAAAATAAPAAERTDRRKQRLSVFSGVREPFVGRLIPPPSAGVKPPTVLITDSHLSMKEELYAQARAAAGLPIRFDSNGMMRCLTIRNMCPPGMPRLQSQAELRKERESEWSRLEKVVSKKLAEHRVQMIALKKQRLNELIEEQNKSDNPPPKLVQEAEAPSKEDTLTSAVIMTQVEGKEEERHCKVLRLRFRRKKEEVDVSKLKVIDHSTRPHGVGQEKEVDGSSLDGSPPVLLREGSLAKKDRRKQIFPTEKKVVRLVARPKLIIVKSDLMKMNEVMENEEHLVAPPPTPVVGIPDKKEYQARRLLYERKRHETMVQAGLKFGRLRLASEQWQRKKLQQLHVRGEILQRALRRKARGDSDDEEDEIEEEALVAESVKILQMIKTEKQRLQMAAEAVEKRRRRKEAEKDILCISDIELDDMEAEPAREAEAEKEAPEAGEVGGGEKKRHANEKVEEALLVSKSVEIVMANAQKMRLKRAVEGEEKELRRKEAEKGILCISGIEFDEKEAGKEDETETEASKKGEAVVELDEVAEEMGADADEADAGAVIDERDEEWRMTWAERKRMEAKMEKEKAREESEMEGGATRRKSHRLHEKRKAMPRKERKLIWRMSDDDDDNQEDADAADEDAESDEPVVVVQPVVAPEKRKRGRPRKNPVVEGPPPKKKKREENKMMTEGEKDLLFRVLPAVCEAGEHAREEPPNMDEMMAMEIEDLTVPRARLEGGGEKEASGAEEEEAIEMPEPLEKQDPKPAQDAPVPCPKRRQSTAQLRQQTVAAVAAAHDELAGRMCRHCSRYQQRILFVPNESMALMDHARTHCVETLMCPNMNCTYMNTHRSRIAQHLSYAHKRWAMPIDLSEVYPSMRKILMMRLRQCFPDLSTLSVCQLCRVAVHTNASHRRWHAQSHLKTQAFECSRNICPLKFSTEQECFNHIQRSNCHGSIVSGMTAEMEKEVTLLLSRCFGPKMIIFRRLPKKDDASVAASDGGGPSITASSSTAQPPSLQKESGEREEERAGPSR